MKTMSRIVQLGSLGLAAVALGSGCAAETDIAGGDEPLAKHSDALHRAPTPSDPSLNVEAGNQLAFWYDAVGVQIYVCQADPTGKLAWTLKAPDAKLHGCGGRAAGTHYAGPTWQAKDGSRVTATRVAGYQPDPTAIPELLLKAATHEGSGRMAKVSFIQRLETTGGTAPASGCDAEHLGTTTRVDYTATYYFYEPKKSRR